MIAGQIQGVISGMEGEEKNQLCFLQEMQNEFFLYIKRDIQRLERCLFVEEATLEGGSELGKN